MIKVPYKQLIAANVLIAGSFAVWITPGCNKSKAGKAMHELEVQAEDGVELFDVQVAFGDQRIPFGVTNHFGKSWFPVRYEPGEDFVMDIVWQEGPKDPSQTSTVTIRGPTVAERSRFDGVLLTYTKADGWTGKVLLKEASK